MIGHRRALFSPFESVTPCNAVISPARVYSPYYARMQISSASFALLLFPGRPSDPRVFWKIKSDSQLRILNRAPRSDRSRNERKGKERKRWQKEKYCGIVNWKKRRSDAANCDASIMQFFIQRHDGTGRTERTASLVATDHETGRLPSIS